MKLSRLERVAREIVETERAYVRDLRSIVEVNQDAHPPGIGDTTKVSIPLTPITYLYRTTWGLCWTVGYWG